jgi:hypothetical protein
MNLLMVQCTMTANLLWQEWIVCGHKKKGEAVEEILRY